MFLFVSTVGLSRPTQAQLSFTEIYESVGLPLLDGGHGVAWADIDGDGCPDLYITLLANGCSSRDARPDLFIHNDGDGNFTEQAVAWGIADDDDRGSHGVAWVDLDNDVDNDGDLDILLVDDTATTGSEIGSHLYLNDGHGNFTFKQHFVQTNGYTGGFADLDNDGDLDLMFAGDDVCYLNDGAGNFSMGPSVPNIGSVMGRTDWRNDPRAMGFTDFDDDGDLDYAVAVKGGDRNLLIRNDYAGSYHWLKVRLISPQGQAGAFGAKTRIYPVGGDNLLGLRESKSNYGYLSQDDPVLHFGLGTRTAVDLEVTFLDGTHVRMSNVSANQTMIVSGVSDDN